MGHQVNALVIRRTVLHDLSVLASRRTVQMRKALRVDANTALAVVRRSQKISPRQGRGTAKI